MIKSKRINERFFRYSDLLCEKIDEQADYFIERIEAMKQGNTEKVEFIENMYLKPLELEISYLANKVCQLL